MAISLHGSANSDVDVFREIPELEILEEIQKQRNLLELNSKNTKKVGSNSASCLNKITEENKVCITQKVVDQIAKDASVRLTGLIQGEHSTSGKIKFYS